MPRKGYGKPEVKVDLAWRLCLMCRHFFLSDGIGNRICKQCKTTDRWQNGV